MGNIDNWLRDFILDFRTESEKLSKEEREKISVIENFVQPCQILFLSIKNVHRQFLIVEHDGNREDLEINVVETESYEAIDKMESILKDPKWNRKLVEGEKDVFFKTGNTFSERLEKVFLKIIRDMASELFRDFLRSALWLVNRC